MEHVAASSGPWIDSLRALAREFPAHIAGIRGLGFMVGVQMTSEPGPWLARLRERGLLAVASGHNVIRLLPPLNATAADLARSSEIFRDTLRTAPAAAVPTSP